MFEKLLTPAPWGPIRGGQVTPAEWSLERRQEYFDWAKQVVDGLRGIHPALEAIFDQAYQTRP